jgi:hypothetical protein
MIEARLGQLTLLGGAVAVVLLGVAALRPGSQAEIAQTRQAAIAPAPSQAPLPPSHPAAPPSPPVVSADGLVLYGISGGGPAGMAAIIGPASGSPRVVPLGRDYRPGLTVKAIGPSHAVLVSGGQETALHLGSHASPLNAQEHSVPTQAVAAPQAGPPGLEATALRLGMKPHRQDGRIAGFELKESRDLALLQRAGLREGDVIVAVNGQAFASEEKLMELPQEIAGSNTAEFDVLRNGKRVKMSLPVNQRP